MQFNRAKAGKSNLAKSAFAILMLGGFAAGASAWGQTIGPDVIGDEVWGPINNYGKSGSVTGYAIGTIACNAGNQEVSWVGDSSQHPVIGQQLYRLKDGRFEQIGLSWAKHEFLAMAEDYCLFGCITPDPYNGAVLGIHCSHSSSADLNGKQTRLGPRGQINAYTGVFPYYFTQVPYPPPGLYEVHSGRRLQVHDADLDPALNAYASYFAEIQYIAADESAAGNGLNSVSYRPAIVSDQGNGVYDLLLTGATVPQTPAIGAWKSADDSVQETIIQVPNEGRFVLAALATDLGNGIWHYEYALYNQTSDRSGQSFFVPVPLGASIANVGFHDVDYHSGDGDSNAPGAIRATDWPATRTNDGITWQTDTWDPQDRQANALRWGTVYNFRFDTDLAPAAGVIVLGLYKPGTPASVWASTVVPQQPVGACCTAYSTCVADSSVATCTMLGGAWLGSGFTCFPNPCLQPSPQLTLTSDKDCYRAGAILTFNIWMHHVNDIIQGGQFFFGYDTSVLDFVSANPAPTVFTLQVYEAMDENVGTIDYATGVPLGPPNSMSYPDHIMAVLKFQLKPAYSTLCDVSNLFWFRPYTPPTRLATVTNPLAVMTVNCTAADHMPPELNGCPSTPITVGCAAIPPPATVTATDNCDSNPQIVYSEDWTDGPGSGMQTLTRTWSVSDYCGNSSICQQIIYIEGPCPGACCLLDQSCVGEVTQAWCSAQTGIWRGPGSQCEPGGCISPVIPTTSEWGNAILIVLLLSASAALFRRDKLSSSAGRE